MESVTVRVPATTANLAAGFDTLGCALQLYNTVQFSCSDRLSFSGCDAAYQNRDNLAYRAFERVCRHLDQPVPALHIAIRAEIPVCSGLGSSSAMLAAGAVAANTLLDGRLTAAELLELLTPLEGHPDNLAPALYGGLTASMAENGCLYTVRYTPHPALHFVVLTPDFPLSTQKAREALPQTVSRADAVYNGAHLAVLLRALEVGDETLIAAALRDRLHQPYRFALIDEYDRVAALAAENGCHAVCISGAGPSVLCLTRDAAFADRMTQGLASLRNTWQLRDLRVDAAGASVINALEE